MFQKIVEPYTITYTAKDGSGLSIITDTADKNLYLIDVFILKGCNKIVAEYSNSEKEYAPEIKRIHCPPRLFAYIPYERTSTPPFRDRDCQTEVEFLLAGLHFNDNAYALSAIFPNGSQIHLPWAFNVPILKEALEGNLGSRMKRKRSSGSPGG